MLKSENFYSFDDVTIDGENFRVQKNGQTITLTPRAFDVLFFLLKNSKRVVEKQEIFDSVWKNTFVSDNALTKIIKEIRQAINDDANQPRYIETVPKRGYRFIADVKNGTETQKSNEASDIGKSQKPLLQLSAKRKNLLIIGAVVLGLLILSLGFLAFSEWRAEIAAENAPIDSIAVLPFENAGQDPNLEYLSDGITENIINSLARLPNLRVLPRSTVFYYKNKPEDPHTIGRMLRVSAVLTGKVVQRGDTLIIQTELIDINRKAQIWGQQYNRPFADVINLQEEISRTIVDRLSLRLTGAELNRLTQRDTDNNEAYQLYLKGNHFTDKRMVNDIAKAVEYYQQAVSLDPNYALAHAGLSEAYSLTVSYRGKILPDEAKLRAKEAALKAMRLNPNLAEANTALGYVLHSYDWNWLEAERVFQRAIELNPNFANAHLRYSEMLSYQARHDEAITEIRRALEIEPLSLVINRNYGSALINAGRTDEAITQLQKTIELDPNFPSAHNTLGNAYERKEMYREAIAEYVRSQELLGNKSEAEMLRDSFAKGGWQGYLQASLKYFQERAKTNYVPASLLASWHAQLGEKEETFKWLEKAYTAREFQLQRLKINPEFQKWRDDPRFRDLLRRVGFHS